MPHQLITIKFSEPTEGQKTYGGIYSPSPQVTRPFEYTLQEPVTITDWAPIIQAEVRLPVVGDKARRVALTFTPEARKAFSGNYSLNHGVMNLSRKNADGRWWFVMQCESDPTTGDITVMGLKASLTQDCTAEEAQQGI
jgi:hypothetical protein